jgi:hypothetical protein
MIMPLGLSKIIAKPEATVDRLHQEERLPRTLPERD